MITLEILLILAALIGAIAFVSMRFVRPWKQIRGDLAQLAAGHFKLSELRDNPGAYVETASHIQKISELLQKLDREVADDGSSLKGILSSMMEGILIANRSQRITLVNDALIGFFTPDRSPLGRSVLEFFRRHELQMAVEEVLAGGSPKQLEITFEEPSPTSSTIKKIFNIHVAPLSPGNVMQPQGVLMVFQDVTAIRSLEATRREFIGNVSHEFKTPLAIINGYVETLLDGAIDEPEMAERSLQAIHRNVQRLTLLIEDLLSISQMESRAKLLEIAPINLRNLLNNVLENLEPNITERRAKIEINWADDAVFADADSRRMEQVYWNLLSNALRYGDVENLLIRISAWQEDGQVVIEISDNGPGIPLEDQAHIFERFYRVRKDRARDAGGTGLGLSIVKHIILAHGGSISVKSTPGQGASFFIRLAQAPQQPQSAFSTK